MRPLDRQPGASRDLITDYREEYHAYYARHATAECPPMRGADPAIILVPGLGMFSWRGQADGEGCR